MQTNSNRSYAFSLVEVAVSIGILSFCLVGIMGLLPVALSSSRQSIDRNHKVRMLETVRADLLRRPYSELIQSAPGNRTEYFFDGEGSLLRNNGSTAPNLQFHVVATHSATTSLPGTQSAARLVTSQITIDDKIRKYQWKSSLHLPDNGF